MGTVAAIRDDQLRISLDDGEAERSVPRKLVMEAHAGRVEVDIAPGELGIPGTLSGEAAPPTRDPAAPPKIATPEQMRRLAGG